jgi:hypothetical protein
VAPRPTLLAVAGIAPLLIAASVIWVMHPGRRSLGAGLWLLGAMIVAAVAAVLTRSLMADRNVLAAPKLVHNAFASTEALPGNFKLWWQSLMVLGNGGFFGKALGFSLRLRVYPVMDCHATLCGFDLHMITSWYQPRPRRRTFLLYDPRLPQPSAPPATLGKPTATHQIGAISMYVYPYDIASRMLR